jgi:AcrR family transcriptional regulator
VAAGSRTRLDPAARRAQLVELGLQMLSTRSLDDLAIEDIAAAAGISRGLLFHYFPSKRDYREAVVRAAAADLLAHAIPSPDVPVAVRLRAGIVAYVDYVSDNRDGYVSMLRGAAGGDPGLRQVFDETRSAIVANILDQIAELGAAEPPERVRLAVRGWVAYGEEVVLDWLSDPTSELDRPTVADLLEQALLALVASAAASGGDTP